MEILKLETMRLTKHGERITFLQRLFCTAESERHDVQMGSTGLNVEEKRQISTSKDKLNQYNINITYIYIYTIA